MSNLDTSNNKVSCVICHGPIDLSHFGREQVTKNFVGCPNGHLCHYDCLKKWIPHSSKCPVCAEIYDTKVINDLVKFRYMVQKHPQTHCHKV